MNYCIRCDEDVKTTEYNDCLQCGCHYVVNPVLGVELDHWHPAAEVPTGSSGYNHDFLELRVLIHPPDVTLDELYGTIPETGEYTVEIEYPNHIGVVSDFAVFDESIEQETPEKWLESIIDGINASYHIDNFISFTEAFPETIHDNVQQEPLVDDDSLWCPDCNMYLPHHTGQSHTDWINNHIAFTLLLGIDHADTDVTDLSLFKSPQYGVNGFCPHCQDMQGGLNDTIDHLQTEHNYPQSDAFKITTRLS